MCHRGAAYYFLKYKTAIQKLCPQAFKSTQGQCVIQLIL